MKTTVPQRIIIFGNSGAGKTVMARQLEQQLDLPRLVLDDVAWDADEWGRRRSLPSSIQDLKRFIQEHEGWIIEGCYGDLIEAAVPFCSELRFLNPGISVCEANCRKRHAEWEQHRHAEDQRSPLEDLLPWVRDYERRDDEFSLARHRAIFDSFDGAKIEYVELPPVV